MKKGYILAIVIIILIVLAIVLISFKRTETDQNENSISSENLSNNQKSIAPNEEGKVTLANCASSGEEGDAYGKQCCSGLIAVQINKVPINNTCLEEYPPYGTQFLCINCGNNVCEEKENKCNCPSDC